MSSARYTVLLKDLLAHPEAAEKIKKALSTYPLYVGQNTENQISFIPTREELNTKILNHYRYREIAFETIGRFIEELEISMLEIMPRYNQLFHSVDIMNGIEDIFGNVNVTETYTEEREGKTVGKGNSEVKTSDSSTNNTTATDKQNTVTNMDDNAKTVHSATPQNELDISAADIDSVPFADDVQWNKHNSSSSGNTSGENASESKTTSEGSNITIGENESTQTDKISHTFTKQGNQGVNTYAHDIKEFRETILNIEQQIINDIRIKELFMLVF